MVFRTLIFLSTIILLFSGNLFAQVVTLDSTPVPKTSALPTASPAEEAATTVIPKPALDAEPSFSPMPSSKISVTPSASPERSAAPAATLKVNPGPSISPEASPKTVGSEAATEILKEKSSSLSSIVGEDSPRETVVKRNLETPPPTEGVVVDMGNTKVKRETLVERFDDDENVYKPGEASTTGGNSSKYFRGGKVVEAGREEAVKYMMISRGAWLIKEFAPHWRAMALEIVRTDNPDLIASFIEVTDSLVYICLLLTSDDGSAKMEAAVGRAISMHREMITRLRLQWPKKSERITKLFDDYIKSTFFESLNKDLVRIPAGEYSSSQYKSVFDGREQIKDEE